ncbi:hypothetical protein PT974_07780 [Cladobotryum mycophilum]|uniref:Uncharacterized protein n=1 Tax=Cladobotryum mycophilum TaxID=491253 RepID=A0ABR0SJ61_9HYPO
MSFGFGVGDFLAVAELSWKLYSQVYKVARDAPEELRGLNQELGNLSNTYKLLVEELENEDSLLRQSGDVRINTARRINEQTKETLQNMQQLSERYASLQKPTEGQKKRLFFRIRWDQLKYSQELHKINDLRSKVKSLLTFLRDVANGVQLMFHNSQMTLLLQGAQNSSLERIEKQTAKTDEKLDELRRLYVYDRAARDQPLLKAPLDLNASIELTDMFLQKAELDGKPWASIGIDIWLQAARWWFIKVFDYSNYAAINANDRKAQSQLDSGSQLPAMHNQAYANLLKASWILTEIVARHPQRTHMGTANDRRTYYIQRLTQGAILRLETFSNNVPQFEDIKGCELDIWAPSQNTAIAPGSWRSMEQPGLNWQTVHGEIIFQCFVMYKDPSVGSLLECICILELPSLPEERGHFNIILQTFSGQDVMRKELRISEYESHDLFSRMSIKFKALADEKIMRCIFAGVTEFVMDTTRCHPDSMLDSGKHPPHPDASVVYLVALLKSCCPLRAPERYRYDKELHRSLDHRHNARFHREDGYFYQQSSLTDIWKPLTRLKSAINFRPNKGYEISRLESVVDRAIHPLHNESGTCCQPIWEDCSRKVLKPKFLDVWELIFWLCKTFEEFLAFIRAAGIDPNDLTRIPNAYQDMLVQTAILRPTWDFYEQLVSYPGIKAGWHFYEPNLVFEVALNKDAGHLKHILKNSSQKALNSYSDELFKLAYQGLHWDNMSALPSLVYPRLSHIVDAIIWLMQHHEERELHRFCNAIRSLRLSITQIDRLQYSYFGKSIATGCCWIMENKGPEYLEAFLDYLSSSGLGFDEKGFHVSLLSTQLTIFPALSSRNALFVKLLLKNNLVSFQLGAFSIKGKPELLSDLVGFPWNGFVPNDMRYLSLYMATGLVSDLQIIEHMCQAGAPLGQLQRTMMDMTGLPRTIERLRATATVQNARGDYLDMKRVCYAISMARSRNCGIDYSRIVKYMCFRETFNSMSRMLLFDGYCQPQQSNEMEMIQKHLDVYLPSDRKGRKHWPDPLQTQENWDEWRAKALGILETYHVKQEPCDIDAGLL